MNKKRKLILIIIGIFIVISLVFIFGGDFFSKGKEYNFIVTKNNVSGYPFVLKSLTSEELLKLSQELKNNCFSINKYGFVEGDNSCGEDIVRKEIKNKDKDEVIKKVEKWLVGNSKFTGVETLDDIKVEKVSEIEGCINCDPLNLDSKVIRLRIDFSRPFYHNLPIKGNISSLVVFADINGVNDIRGFWLPKINVPTQELVSEIDIKKELLGKSTGFSDFVGKSIKFKIKEKHLTEPASKVIFVTEKDQGLEFRLAWEIKISYITMFYIDAITGEKIGEIPIMIS